MYSVVLIVKNSSDHKLFFLTLNLFFESLNLLFESSRICLQSTLYDCKVKLVSYWTVKTAICQQFVICADRYASPSVVLRCSDFGQPDDMGRYALVEKGSLVRIMYIDIIVSLMPLGQFKTFSDRLATDRGSGAEQIF